MEHFLDESGRQELVDLIPDDPALLLVKSTQVLSHRPRVGSNVQGVLDDFPWYARQSEGLHANTSAFTRRKSTSTASYLGSSWEPMLVTCSQML
jgi:hypothetical protein